MLLNLAENRTRADGVGGAGGDKKGVAGVDRDAAQAALRCTAFDGLAKTFAGYAGLEPEAEVGAFARGDRVPHFGLADFGCGFVGASVFVVGMDLHGKLVFGKDEFDEQRDARLTAEAGSRPFRGQSGPGFGQRAPGKSSVCEAALFTRQPDFADGVSARRTIEERSEAAGAPDAWHEDGRQTRGGEFSRVHVAAAAEAKKRSRRRRPSSMRSMDVA